MPESSTYNRLIQDLANPVTAESAHIDLKENLQNIVETTAGVFDAESCLLFTLDPFKTEGRLLVSKGLDSTAQRKIRTANIADLAEIKQNRTLLVENAESDPRTSGLIESMDENIVSVIGLPFSVTPEISMLLLICLTRPLTNEEKNPQLHTAVSRQTAAAVKNAIQQSQYLETFSEVSASIHQGEEVEDILNIIVTHIQEIMEARGCIFWILNTAQKNIHMKATSGFQMENLSLISYENLEAVFDFYSEKDIYFEDVREDPRIPSATSLGKQMVISILGIPFPIVEPFRGILAVYFSSQRPIKRSEIEFVRDAGRQGAIALHKAFRYDERVFKALQETIQGLVMALEAKDVCTHGHSLNVAAYAKLTALELGLGEKEADNIYHAGLLHDIGKIAMEDTILRNLGNLTRSQVSRYDIETVEKHPVIGALILEPLSSLGKVAHMVKYHHERYDGKGYPEGLSGEDIPIGAKIIAVCDGFDAMTSERPGTTTLDTKKAMAVLKMHSGTKFDPEVVSAFMRVIEKDPDAVKPFTLTEDYLTRHAETLNAKKKRSSILARLLKIGKQ